MQPQGLGIVALCLFWSCGAESESGQGPGGVAGVVAAGGGDVPDAGEFHDPDDQVAQGGHDLRAVAGADMVQRLKMSSRLRLWDVVGELLGEAWVNAGLPAARFLEPVVQLAGLRGRGEDYPAVRWPGLLAARDAFLA